MLFNKKRDTTANITTAKLEVYSATQHAIGLAVNKQIKDKILAKRIDAHIEHSKC